MQIKTAVILAGGLGTRLQSVVAALPKPMAPIGDKPFLYYQMKWLRKCGIERIILSVGYKSETIESYFGNQFEGASIEYIIERELLGTGGATFQCMKQVGEDIILVNGDTFFPIDLAYFVEKHSANKSAISIALKEVLASDRYGTVQLHGGIISEFEEKKYIERGYINGGIYALNKSCFDGYELPQKFSLEVDYLQQYTEALKIQGIPFETYFIDIGIPDDYARGQEEIPQYFARE
ncbi:MAG: nucleotidyltransferase family protein [Chitinophagales bacterium]|nr:nucleotidyltransferase family protein [Chitinophagales bacterium]